MSQLRRSPTLRRRRLYGELRRLREADGRHAQDVDKELGWTPGKLARMERGDAVRPSLRDIRDLLDLYGVTDERVREEILTLAREGREKDWWIPWRDMLSKSYTTYMGLETEASSVHVFESAVFPGLLQTEDYARAMFEDGPLELSESAVQERLHVRMGRKKLLTAEPNPLRLWAIIDEAVLHRQVGGPEVMRAQLRHVLELTSHPKITLQVVPFSKGAHAGISGSFTLLEFSDPRDSAVCYTENLAGELLLESAADIEVFKVAMQRLQGRALDHRDSQAMLVAAVERL